MKEFTANNMRAADAPAKETARKPAFLQSGVLVRLIQGAFIGLGAILPGVSGGVLCVVFGVYKPIVELLSHPVRAVKKYARLLIPILIGLVVGFLGIAHLLGFLLEAYPDPSVCFFVGLIAGMLPSLFREAGKEGRGRHDYLSLGISFAVVLSLLLGLSAVSVSIRPNFLWYLFCGFCVALSMIVPGMSFSTLLMPLGLYTPLVVGIGNMDFGVLLPAGIGAVLTVLLLAKAVAGLMERHYSTVFHAIIGVVIAATLVIVPFRSFASGVGAGLVNGACLLIGAAAALLLDALNRRAEVPEA